MNAGGGYICVMTVYCYAWVVVVCMYIYTYMYRPSQTNRGRVSK